MTNRTVAVSVKLLAKDYFAGLRAMEAETKKTGTSAEASFTKMKAGYSELGRTSAVVSGALVLGFGAMVKASADFEQRMSQVQALSKATSAQMDRLRGAAFNAGKAFGLSATQVADAQIELTKAGVSVRDIIGGALPGALALAAAGQIDVAKATEIASNAMTEFKLNGRDVPHVADLLAAGADKSVASVDSLGDALNQSGLVAAQFGLSVEDTVGTLTAFSKAGLNGSDAGTSFKTMLSQLASPSKQAQEQLEKYNITAYDSRGAFVGITNLAEQLRTKLSGANGVDQASRNAALSIIFGTDAIRAASVLYDLGGKKLQGFIDRNNEAGFAALQASKKLDNLNGDIQKLGAAFQNDLIESGSAGNDVLRGMTQNVTGVLDGFSALPKPVQSTGLAITGVGAAVTAAGAAFLLLTPKIAAAKAAMNDLKISGKGAVGIIGKGGAIVAGVTAAAGAFAALSETGDTTSQQLSLAATSVKNDYKGLDKLFAATAGSAASAKKALSDSYANGLTPAGWNKAVDGITSMVGGLTHFADVYKTNEGQFKALGEQLGAIANTNYGRATSSFNEFVRKLGGGQEVTRQALEAFPAYREELIKLLNSSGKAATQANILAAATGRGGVARAIRDAQTAAAGNERALNSMAGAATDAKVDVNKLSDAIKGFGSVTLDARSAQRDFAQAVDDARQAAGKAGDATKDTTQADRDKQAALDNVAQSALGVAAAFAKQPGGVQKAEAALADGRKAFIDVAKQMGIGKARAEELADSLGLIPRNVAVTVGVNPGDSLLKISQVASAMAKLQDKRIDITSYYSAVGTDAAKGAAGRAAGGAISGPGPKGKDSVLTVLAPGEHVLTAGEVDKMGGQSAVYAFRKGLMAFAKGGAVDSIQAQRAAAEKADRDAKRYAAQLKAAKQAANRAGKAYDAIDGTKANASAKKAAKARQDAADKRVDDLQKKLDDARQKRTDATAAVADLRNDREDFVSGQRRATADNPIDPLSYVDQLRSMSRDDNFSKTRRKAFDDTANKYEASLVKQQVALDKATQSLNGFKDAADSMRSGITSAIAGQYGAGNIPTTMSTKSGSIVRNGIRLTTYSDTSSYTAAGIDSYFAKGASSTGSFAKQLDQLRARGLNGAFLAEIAQDPNGPQLAATLLSATTGQITSINRNYAAIQSNAARAAGTVTDYNYKALIDNAQANADQITKQIATDGEKLRKLIASAFGLTGYAIGTMNATPGWHLVGEKGPELLRFAGGEQVATATRTRSMIAAANSRGAATQVHVHVHGDDSVLASAMRVVAGQVVTAETQALVSQYPG